MRRILIYVAILAGVLVLPVQRQDVGKLHPVQVVSVYKEDRWVVMETDTEDKGYGSTAQLALQNLKDTSDGIVYLDTAEFLLLTKDTQDAAEELREALKPAVRLCLTAKPVDLPKAAKYLSTHSGLPSLSDGDRGEELPILSTFGDSLIFLKKVEKRA